jgi:hypothetical protein
MSEYECSKCRTTTHCSELHEVKTKEGIELLCDNCFCPDIDFPDEKEVEK